MDFHFAFSHANVQSCIDFSPNWTLQAAYSAKSPIFPDFTTILDLLTYSLACKVQSAALSYSIWTSMCLFTTSASNPPPQLHRILHSTCQSTAQKSSVRMKSGGYSRKASPLKLSLINFLLFHFSVDICPKQRIAHRAYWNKCKHTHYTKQIATNRYSNKHPDSRKSN